MSPSEAAPLCRGGGYVLLTDKRPTGAINSPELEWFVLISPRMGNIKEAHKILECIH